MARPAFRIFVSSTAKDLAEYRGKVVEAIRGLHQSAETFEVWDALPTRTVQACRDAARGADITVVLVAHYAGWKPTRDQDTDCDGQTSITEIEVAAARERGRDVLAFVVADGFEWKGLRDTDAGDVAKLAAFKDRLHMLCTPRRFTTPDNLQALVTQSLANWVLAHRPVDSAEQKAIADYFDRSLKEWRRLPLSIDRRRADARRGTDPLTLDQVYIGLNVVERRSVRDAGAPAESGGADRQDKHDRPGAALDSSDERSPLAALEACGRHQRAVILGAPGSGKSSLLRMLAIELAKPHVGEPVDDGAPLPFDRALLPVFVVVRELAEKLPSGRPEVQLPTFIRAALEDRHLGSSFAPIDRRLRDGEAILLLDGLDEITQSERRSEVIAAIRAFVDYHPKTRVLVTCRVAAYPAEPGGESSSGSAPIGSDDGWRLPFPVFELVGFDQNQQHRFIDGWYRVLEAGGRIDRDVTARAAELRRAVRRPDLRRMASNPLLLTLMAIVHESGGDLPEERALLYEKAVETLLWEWQHGRDPAHEADDRGVRAVLDLARKSKSNLETRLWSLAKAVHSGVAGKERDHVADIPRDALIGELERLHPEHIGRLEWVGKLIGALTQRSGLLVETRSGVYAFPHRTFQEYLAARALASAANPVREALPLRLPPNDFPIWREPILLMAGVFAHVAKAPRDGTAFLGRLIDEASNGHTDEERRIEDLDLAADVVGEMGKALDDVDEAAEIVSRLRAALHGSMFDEALSMKNRARVGAALGRIGDPRPGVGSVRVSKQGARFPQIDWADVIEAGEFPMGNDPPGARYRDEQPRFVCRIAEPFALAKYPVTVAQYRLFIEAGGYRPGQADRFWTAAGRAWRDANKVTGPRTDDLPEVFETPNHPQVRVSWYEATAFCRWLREVSELPIRLPTESEWERAARHTDARTYPWGESSSAEEVVARANVDGSIGHTTPVGLYHRGAAVCKAVDMGGNVWEWCQTQWRQSYEDYPRQSSVDDDEGKSTRVVRGGSWDDRHDFARCAFRLRYVPDGRDDNVGFRVCVCPFSPSGL